MSEPTYEELVGPEAVQDEDLEEGAKLVAHDLFLRLQGTFSAPAYITLQEVRDATGFDGVRTADAIAVSLYRSRGKAIWGFEMKVSRSDWLHELKQPEKAESIMRYCDHWALVVPNKDIVKPGELPATWGMYVAQKNRLKCVVPCPKLDPLPMSITMLTALIYNVDHSHKMADKNKLEAEYNRGYEAGSRRDYDKGWESNFHNLQERVHLYEQASGLSIEYGWHRAEKVGEIVKAILEGKQEIKQLLSSAKWGVKQAERNKEALQEYVDILTKVMGEEKAS